MKKSAVVFLILTFLVSSLTKSTRAADGSELPQSSLILPNVKRDTLLNGLQLIVLEQPGTGTVSAHLRVNSGAMFDLAGKGGLADLTAAMILKGGGGLNSKAVSDNMEQLGLTVKLSVGWDSTDIVIGGPADTLESLFDLLGKLIITPAFDAGEIESAKTFRVQGLKTEAGGDIETVTNKALEALYGVHPYGHRITGSAESIALITRPDLVYFHNRFYIANNSELAITGDVTAEQVTSRARSKLGAWKKGDRVPATFRPPELSAVSKVLLLDRADGGNAMASIAQVGPARRSQDYFAALIAADLLTQDNARTAKTSGTAIETRVEPRYLEGPVLVLVKGPQASVRSALEEVLANLSRLQSASPSLEQIEAAKSRLISSYAERLRTPQGAVDLLLDIELYGLGRDYLVSLIDRVNAVAPADILRAAQSYFKPQSVTLVVAGPASELASPLKKIGTITVLK